VSVQNNENTKQMYTNLEHILELGGAPFVNDVTAEVAKAEEEF
jgi:hypothetical protein